MRKYSWSDLTFPMAKLTRKVSSFGFSCYRFAVAVFRKHDLVISYQARSANDQAFLGLFGNKKSLKSFEKKMNVQLCSY